MLTPSTDTSNRARSAEAMLSTDGVRTGHTITCNGSTPELWKGLRFFGVLPAGAACPVRICGMQSTGGTTERNTHTESDKMITKWHLDRLLELRKKINELENTIKWIGEKQHYRPELELYYKELREFNAEIERLSSDFGEIICIIERTHTATHECEGCKDHRTCGSGCYTQHFCRCRDRCADCVKVKEGIERK